MVLLVMTTFVNLATKTWLLKLREKPLGFCLKASLLVLLALFAILSTGCGGSLPTEDLGLGYPALQDSERLRPVRPEHFWIERLDSWHCSVGSVSGEWALYAQGGVIRARGAYFPCPASALLHHPEWGNGSRTIEIYAGSGSKIAEFKEVWP